MEAVTLVEQLWARMDRRDWDGVASLLHPDLVVAWPATAERIVGPEDFVALNAEYPEGWSIDVLRVVGSGEQAVAEVRVPHRELGDFAVASFWKSRDGLLHRGIEYWTTIGGQNPPDWRAHLTSPM